MAVQHKVGRSATGQQHGNSLDPLPNLAGHSRGLQLQRGVVVTVDNFPVAHLASQRFREREGIEGQQHFVVLAQLVAEHEADWDELSWFASAFGGQALDRVEFGFQNAEIHLHLHWDAGGQPPFGNS